MLEKNPSGHIPNDDNNMVSVFYCYTEDPLLAAGGRKCLKKGCPNFFQVKTDEKITKNLRANCASCEIWDHI